jgi:hypothetical protein
MVSFFKKNKVLVLGAAAVAGWYFFLRPKTAAAATGGGATPTPSTGGGSTQFQDVLILQPGPITEQMPAGGEIDLQLPLGAAWDQGTPVSQAAGSSIGATVDPLVPVGAEQQAWKGVKGSGSIVANWIDATGTPQTTTIAVATT